MPARKAWVFAARLAVTLAVAKTVRLLVPLEKPYWIVLTAALVLKPDFGSVFARGVQRTLGTLVGVVLGVAVVAVVPHGAWLLLPIAALAFAFPYGRSLNYGLLSTFVTPLVLLLIDFGTRVDGRVALDRLLDTVIGAGVVLVVGYRAGPARGARGSASTSPPGWRPSPATPGWRSAPTAASSGPRAGGRTRRCPTSGPSCRARWPSRHRCRGRRRRGGR